MSPDSSWKVVEVAWALAASLTVVRRVKYEVWESGTDMLEHALEQLRTGVPSRSVLRHVIQVVAHLQELPSAREWFLSHGTTDALRSVVAEEGHDHMGISLPIVTIKGDFMGQGSIDITKSTLESLENFFEEGFYLPGVLVLLCSVVVPIVKLLMMLVIFIIRHTFPEKAHQLMFVLRIIAKYQMLDIFVTVIMVAFLNQDVMRTTLQTGFYYYLAFCLLSIGATQVLWSMLPDRPQALYAQQLARWMRDRQTEIAFKNITGRSPDQADHSSLVHYYTRNTEVHGSVPFGEALPEGRRQAAQSGACGDPLPELNTTPLTTPQPNRRRCEGDRACSSVEEVEAQEGDRKARISRTPSFGAAASEPLAFHSSAPPNEHSPESPRVATVNDGTLVVWPSRTAEQRRGGGALSEVTSVASTFNLAQINKLSLCGSIFTCGGCCRGFEFSLDTFFLYGACITFYIGLYWSLYHSVLTVKVAFKESLIVSQSTLGLFGMIDGLVKQHEGINYFIPAVVFAVFALIVPCVQVGGIFIAGTLHVLPCHKTSHTCADLYRWLLYLIDYISDWAMMDVFSVAMFTTLISLNAFDALRADAPPGLLSGFYFLLMAGLASMDLATQTHELLMDAMARNVVEMATEMIILEHEQEESLRDPEYMIGDQSATTPRSYSSFTRWRPAHPDDAIADRPNAVERSGSMAIDGRTDITSMSRRDPTEWQTFRILRRELRRNASRAQKQASSAAVASAMSSPPISPNVSRRSRDEGDIEDGHALVGALQNACLVAPGAAASESLMRRSKSLMVLPRSKSSLVATEEQQLHQRNCSLLSSLAGGRSLAESARSVAGTGEKVPAVLEAAKRKVEQYVDMEAIVNSPRRRRRSFGDNLDDIQGHQKDTLDGERRAGRDDKGKHYRLVATDESENNDSDNDSTADKAVPPLWKRLLQRMTGTVLVIKAVSWGIFFIVWSMHTSMPPVDLDVINLSLRGNLPLINGALQDALPSSLGACTIDPLHIAPKPCVGNSSLYYVRERVYEVNARWVTGLRTTKLENIYLSVPKENRLALSIEGIA
ncbi:hypothetical protein Pmar_PMAR001943 [Perkinsus marinus ATCC 50983]|uniref:Uncharacterized protein n=1 Tax=Perkinsus marinus (strain ATCC 50983 / TXsc) TaxID=423536 RepID=C5KJ28_PERM5|nr:hypothetical protein Pmar_PMAR001943 [Perkinsus marinus ATCC 50983]EER15521.1 hypothetical protein Pmar_PMAR001943 [Perkinsus marinus ATCC 50983]|eukprot:XP_002783725.1 hypothetical protein Pmar_PMAR001943 [Perkinsus marinus ATCC 50983]